MNRVLFVVLGTLVSTAAGNLGVVHAAPFTPGDIAVVHVGDGKIIPSASNLGPAYIDEYTTAGKLVQSIPLPASAAGSNHALTLSSSRTEGQLSLSSDGQYLVVPGISGPANTNGFTLGRTVGRIDAQGKVDTTTSFTDAYNAGSNLRGAVSTDGTGFWLSGTDGSHYVPLGGSSTTALSSVGTAGNAIFDGQLYTTSVDGPNHGVYQIGSGLPTSGAQSATLLPNLSDPPTNVGGLAIFDLNNAIAGPDTIYVGVFPTSGFGLEKWTFDGTKWNLAETFSNGLGGGILQVTGDIENGVPVLYGTTRPTGGGGNLGNTLVRLVDDGVNNTFTTLATVGANEGLRGVAFVPVAVPEPSTYVLSLIGVAGVAMCWWRRTALSK